MAMPRQTKIAKQRKRANYTTHRPATPKTPTQTNHNETNHNEMRKADKRTAAVRHTREAPSGLSDAGNAIQ